LLFSSKDKIRENSNIVVYGILCGKGTIFAAILITTPNAIKPFNHFNYNYYEPNVKQD
jgi:hypothetical protein